MFEHLMALLTRAIATKAEPDEIRQLHPWSWVEIVELEDGTRAWREHTPGRIGEWQFGPIPEHMFYGE